LPITGTEKQSDEERGAALFAVRVDGLVIR